MQKHKTYQELMEVGMRRRTTDKKPEPEREIVKPPKMRRHKSYEELMEEGVKGKARPNWWEI